MGSIDNAVQPDIDTAVAGGEGAHTAGGHEPGQADDSQEPDRSAGGDQPEYQPTLENYQTTRLYIDEMEYSGHMSTHSLDSWITDSAAAVTASARDPRAR